LLPSSKQSSSKVITRALHYALATTVCPCTGSAIGSQTVARFRILNTTWRFKADKHHTMAQELLLTSTSCGPALSHSCKSSLREHANYRKPSTRSK
jgi:hypothetical protein